MGSIVEMLTRGMQLLQAGQLADAERTLLDALLQDKENSRTLFALGVTNYQLGRLADAQRYLSASISRSPDFLPAHNNLGLVHKAMGDQALAIAVLRRAVAIAPGYVDALYNLALTLEEAGERAEAAQLYRRIIELKPDFIRAHTNLGLMLRSDGDAAGAHRHLEFVAAQAPDDATALINLALVLTDLARYPEAIRTGTQATQLAPDSVGAWEALGNALRLGGDASNAAEALQRAHALQPDSAEIQYELGLAQAAAGDLAAAHRTLDVVARLRPDWLKVQLARDLALPLVYMSDQHIADSRAGFVAGIEKIEGHLVDARAWSVQEGVEAIAGYAPFYLHYQGIDNTTLQRRFARIVERVAKRAWPQFSEPVSWKPRAHGGRLRVGFVSAYLRRHSVGFFFGDWICRLDGEKFESFVWYTGETVDDVSIKIGEHAAHYWHLAFDAATLAAAIRARQLDVLIYLDVGMHPQSQLLAALRLAPVQCATFGHPATTGFESIDYFLSADAAEPDDAAQHYTEKLLRLPRFAVSYERPDVSRRRLPAALAPGAGPLVVCAQPLFKLLPHFDRLVAQIVRASPGCRLAFIASMWPRVNKDFVDRISATLRGAGADPTQTLQLLPIMPYEEYLGVLAAADVVLDSTGFSGGNSSFDAIAVGAPIVTCRGAMLRARQTTAMLDIVGLSELACESDSAYVAQAIRLASNKDAQREVRSRLATGSAALFDDVAAVLALERMLDEITS